MRREAPSGANVHAVKHLLSIESFREVNLATWDEPRGDATRVRFAAPVFAEQYLRAFVDDPNATAGIRALVAARAGGGGELDELSLIHI